jgi:hypothetical protein
MTETTTSSKTDTFETHRDAVITRRLQEMPSKHRSLYLKVINGEASPRQCIKVMCLECVGWQRNDVAHCTAPECPVYQHRPFKAPLEDVAEYHRQTYNGLRLPDHWPEKPAART